ncbi:hypothetical protein AMTRI_Chr13g125200 [Amborella trichopoda]|uniref:Vacuolar iron transporter n=1 Tax=Amborella trichopoda TaxID=13333 RepID=U5DB74_AMBTC|nr:vacuolar iron transporter homolog 1 [Amborella trichopoda]ERN17643.1 hypothetical protein AMTR_s00059p00177640 [Amborella trichopoda]|eukprot:XP_006856176.1 vacuolar iron transporter homolog 1 [Amborella trichopoda]
MEQQHGPHDHIIEPPPSNDANYKTRGQWLRAAILGANDGLVSTTSLMLGISAVRGDARSVAISGIAALAAGASSMAIGEFVSVYTQRDIQAFERERQGTLRTINGDKADDPLPNPFRAATASALSFMCGALVPLLCGAFVQNYVARVLALVGASSFTLLLFGSLGAHLGGSSIWRASLRVLFGGWLAMAATYGFLKLF